MAKTKSETKKTNLLVFVGIGCLVLIVVVGLVVSAGIKFVTNRAGVKIKDLAKGNVTYTDTKTGTKVDIGGNKVPDNFPKDFPLYPGAKVTSVLSGAQAGKANGFWLTMSTPDGVDKVTAHYKTQLESTGWSVQQTFTAGDTMTETVSKDVWGGSLSISKSSSDKETNIVIILGSDK